MYHALIDIYTYNKESCVATSPCREGREACCLALMQQVKIVIYHSPAEIGRLMHLHSLSIATNNLTRVHPALTFSNSSNVVLINFCFNNLTRTLPESWGQNKNMRVFIVAYNKLEGNLPDWIWDLHSLQLLDFSNNKFTGRIPTKIDSLQALRKDNDTQYEPETLWNDKIILNFKGTLLYYDYFFSTQAFLDLSGKRLTGQIPSEIGFLNCLQWPYPQKLGNLMLLESLDLVQNSIENSLIDKSKINL
jgi:Leucine-rich repeat (LRR) protein